MRSLALVVLAGALLAGCQQSSTTATSAQQTATATTTTPAPAAVPGETRMPNGLVIQDISVGNGAVAEDGKSVSVHYTGWLTDGTKFDSSRDRQQPFNFTLGAGMVIPGWDQGVKGMRVGGKRKLTIPPALGYGAQGTPGGPIPPNATLVFDVELMGVR